MGDLDHSGCGDHKGPKSYACLIKYVPDTHPLSQATDAIALLQELYLHPMR